VALDSFADARNFALYREDGHLVFTLLGQDGTALTENEARTLPKERRTQIDQNEQELRAEIARYLDKTRPIERAKNEALAALRCQTVKPLLAHSLHEVTQALSKQVMERATLEAYLDRVMQDILDNLDAFRVIDPQDELQLEELANVLARYRVNLVVDNAGLTGAPVVIENNPTYHNLFGSIEYQAEEDVLMTDFYRIRAGSLLKAHGGFLMLHVRDLLSEELLWERLRRFSRTGRLQIEEPMQIFAPMATVSLAPEALDISVKIVLVGTTEEYYLLQEADPEFARRFRVKVDFAESFVATAQTYAASSVFVAHTCKRLGLPHFSAAAMARLLENAHRETDDQGRQSAVFAKTEALVIEAGSACLSRRGTQADAKDVADALEARRLRHNYPDQRMRETITGGDRLISLRGEKVGQINGLTQIDLGDYRFGFPVRVTAHTSAGDEGLVNIEREVELSGPIHDKGVLILHSYLSTLFAHLAPLALNATIAFEQEYHGIEGDSASCAELYVLLSCLSGLALTQGIAVTGAVNQHGEILPVGGINEKIEGFFRVCDSAGLTGKQGVLIPKRNRHHLMLNKEVTQAVALGRFHVYAAENASEGIELLTGHVCGLPGTAGGYASDTLLGRAQKTLQTYRRACHLAEHPKVNHKHSRFRNP
jgi:predicted ATP-dependent protease